MRYDYLVLVPLPGGENWYELCRVTTPTACAELLSSLMRNSGGSISAIKILIVPSQS